MKNDLLLRIANKGYVIAFGANVNYATYDIVKNVPGVIGFLSIVVGICGLVWQAFSAIPVSVGVLILGIASVYIERFSSEIDSYIIRADKNTDQWNRLKNLYYKVKSMKDDADFCAEEILYERIEQEFNSDTQACQIFLFSNWLAHFKLFGQKDVSWMDEQLHFHWWKDKIPKTAQILIYMLILTIIIYYCIKVPELNIFFCTIFFIE